jgi:single-strand DNA-binding protein
MNTAVFAGRVGQDAELNYTKSGTAVASFSMAIDNGKDKDGQKRPATWIKAVLWEKRAESLAQYIKKGIVVIVSGPVSTEAWTSKQDGSAQAKIVCTVREFDFGGSKSEDNGEQQSPRPAQAAAPQGASPITDEDIPF